MLTTYDQQANAVREMRKLITKDKNLLNSLDNVPETFSEFDQSLNDAVSSIFGCRTVAHNFKQLESLQHSTMTELVSIRIEMRESLMRLGNLIDKKNKIQAAELLGQLIKKLNS